VEKTITSRDLRMDRQSPRRASVAQVAAYDIVPVSP
jgi:hypothetical protein